MAAVSPLDSIHQEEELIRAKLASRGCNRSAIIRKEAQKKMKKLKKKEKSIVKGLRTQTGSDDDGSSNAGDSRSHSVVWDGRGAGHTIIAELFLPPNPDLFLPSMQINHWKRDQSAAYHLDMLRNPENPLSRRVAAWEDLSEQPEEYERTEHLKDAWRRREAQPDDDSRVYGDEAMFRDLPSLAEQMDCHMTLETCFRLSDGKPSPYEPACASSIVLYKGDPASSRVSGAVVFDSLGQARVDVNFQHHCKFKGVYQVLSGHWHILAIGSHSHESGLDTHFDFSLCPWLWQAIPREFGVLPVVPVGQ